MHSREREDDCRGFMNVTRDARLHTFQNNSSNHTRKFIIRLVKYTVLVFISYSMLARSNK